MRQRIEICQLVVILRGSGYKKTIVFAPALSSIALAMEGPQFVRRSFSEGGHSLLFSCGLLVLQSYSPKYYRLPFRLRSSIPAFAGFRPFGPQLPTSVLSFSCAPLQAGSFAKITHRVIFSRSALTSGFSAKMQPGIHSLVAPSDFL